MNILFDILIIFFMFMGVYIMKNNGFLKNVVTFIILYVASFAASKLSTLIFNLTYKDLPFLNLVGKAQGIKIINVYFWRSIFFIGIFIIIFASIQKILEVTGLEEKLEDDVITTGKLSTIMGCIVSIASMCVVIFDVTLILLFPMFRLKPLIDSTIQKAIVTNIPILYKDNKNYYDNAIYTIKRISKKDNTSDNIESVSQDIIDHMLASEFMSDDIILTLEEKNKLIGFRDKQNNSESQSSDDEEYEEGESDNQEDGDEYEDDNSYDDGTDQEDEDYDDSITEDEDYDDDEDLFEDDIYEPDF